MRKLVAALLAGGSLLMVVPAAEAHNVSASIDCTGNVSFSYSNFPDQQTVPWTVTDNGVQVGSGSFPAVGGGAASGTFTAPTSPGSHALVVTATWVGGAGVASATVTCDVPEPPPPPPPPKVICRDGQSVEVPGDYTLAPGETEGECKPPPPPPDDNGEPPAPPPNDQTDAPNGTDDVTDGEVEEEPKKEPSNPQTVPDVPVSAVQEAGGASPDGGGLPHTGLVLLPVAVAGLALCGLGGYFRRRL